jgi:hypothetical protein
MRRSHSLLRLSSAKASHQRKFFKRHTKTNQIDAHTFAKLPCVDSVCSTPSARSR